MLLSSAFSDFGSGFGILFGGVFALTHYLALGGEKKPWAGLVCLSRAAVIACWSYMANPSPRSGSASSSEPAFEIDIIIADSRESATPKSIPESPYSAARR